MIRLGRTPTADQRGGGASSQAPSDLTVQFSKVVSSSLSQRTGAIQYSVTGIAGMDFTLGSSANIPLDNDTKAESIDDAEHFTSPGIIGRPLPPEKINGISHHMEVLCIRTTDGLIPVSYRDLRLRMGIDKTAPGEGVFAFVGYGGGFHSLSPVDAGDGGTLHVIYCPYDFDASGVAQKAHVITMDPTSGNESITIVHANGLAITMSNDDKKALVLKNAAGDATLRLDDDGITATAKQITLSGTVIVGEPSLALPLLPGTASQGSSNFRLSP